MTEETISTGVRNLDLLIKNGLPTKALIHIYGESGTGKSTLVMQCAKNCVEKGWNVLFLDNERTCSSTRLESICQANYEEIAQSILVYEPLSFENQTETIETLERYITDQTKMILVDTITTQYRRALSEKSETNILLNKILNRQVAILKDLAIKFHLVVLVANQVRGKVNKGNTPSAIEPVAAKILNYWADYEIELGFLPDHQMGERVAVITKHPTRSEILQIKFRLTDDGIRDPLEKKV